MKKLILTAVLFILSFSMLSASNGQTVYTTRDEEYIRVEELCRRAGVIGPSSFSPMPARALLIAMERIDASALSEEDRNEYEELYTILTDDKYTFSDDYFEVDFNAAANLGVNLAPYNDFRYDNSDSKLPDYDRREDTLIPYRYEDPLFALGLKMDFGEHIALEARLDLKSNHLRMYESTLGGVFTFLPDTRQGLAAEIPFRAGGSFGNDYFNFIIGRFPHSAGSGVTGNLIIGDNFNYQEVMLASLQSNHLTTSTIRKSCLHHCRAIISPTISQSRGLTSRILQQIMQAPNIIQTSRVMSLTACSSSGSTTALMSHSLTR